MTAYHIIDIEKTDANDAMIEKLELILCATFEPATIITDGEGSMYSIYSETKGISKLFAEGALAALQFFTDEEKELK